MFTIEGYITYEIYYMSITKEILNNFVKTQVLFYCAGRQRPQSVLVMHNITSHYNPDLVVIYYEANVLLAYLPPYSPNFNFIKTFFFILKY